MRSRRTLLLILGPFIHFSASLAQTAVASGPTEEEREAIRRGVAIREKLREQYGGTARLGGLVTVHRVVDGVLSVGEMEFPLKLDEYLDMKQPRGRYTSREPGNKSDAGFDGQRSWVYTPVGAEPLSPLEPSVFLRGWMTDPHILLANDVCEFLFSKQQSGEDATQLSVHLNDPQNGDLLAVMWVDAASFLVRRIVKKNKGATVETIYFDDYRMVQNIPFAFQVTTHAQGGVVSRQTLLQVILNPKLPPDFYKEPPQ